MNTWTQRSFAGGEISPAVGARADMVKYQTGLALCQNFIVERWGGVKNRTGTWLVGETKHTPGKVRLVPFVVDIQAEYLPTIQLSQNYLLEFGDHYVRVHHVGLRTFSADWAITNILQSSPCQVTAPGHTLANGDEVGIALVGGMDEINERYFKVANVSGNTFTLKHLGDGLVDVDSRGFGAYTSGGIVAKVLEYVTPWGEDDLEDLDLKQSGDILRVCHPDYPIYDISRLSASPLTFAIAPTTLGPTLATPAAPVAVGGAAAPPNYTYKVTAVKWQPYSESYGSVASNIVGKSAPATPVTVTWAAVAGADEYNVYREQNGAWYWIGNAGAGLTFLDEGGAPDFTGQPPEVRLEDDGNAFLNSVNHYPATLCFYQQRQGYAAPRANPARIMFSRTGEFANFSLDIPTRSDSPVTMELTGPQITRVRHMVDIGRLVIFTDTGEFVAEGDAAGVLTPFDINLRQEGYVGSAKLAPIVANGSVIYVQARGDIIREFSYEFQVDGYRGNDMTVFASHLFEDKTIQDWAFSQAPHPILWVVTSNGTLLGMTYMKEQSIWAWHQHNLGGKVEAVAVVPEMDAISNVSTDVLYVAIRRTLPGLAGLGGSERLYIERLAPAVSSSIDNINVDCSRNWWGRNGNAAVKLKVTNGVTWQRGEAMSVQVNVALFTPDLVGNEFWLFTLDGTGTEVIQVHCRITAYTSPTQVEVLTDRDVPVELQDVWTFSWSLAIKELGGLWHIEGERVSVKGAGKVLANPLNPQYAVFTVTNGRITLDNYSDVLHIGLPITSEIQTLDLDIAGPGDNAADKLNLVQGVTVIVKNTRGLWAGSNERLFEFKIREDEPYDDFVSPVTGKIDVNCDASWGNGRVRIVQIDPLPCNILGVIPAGISPIGSGG